MEKGERVGGAVGMGGLKGRGQVAERLTVRD